MSADRNLLFGILALQMDFISRDALVASMHAWVLEKHKPLAEPLGRVPDARALLEPVAAKHLQMHGDDPQQSIATLSSVEPVRRHRPLVAAVAAVIVAAVPLVGLLAANREEERKQPEADKLEIKASVLGTISSTFFSLRDGGDRVVEPFDVERGIQTREESLDRPVTLSCMGNVAESYQEAGKPDLPLLEETLALKKSKLGTDHPDTLRCMGNLALGYWAAGKLDRALPLLEETLKLMKSKLGADHPDTLRTMHNLALGYHTAGKLDRALPLLEETLALNKSKLGVDHPDTLMSMHNLAGGYQSAGKLDRALPLYDETLKLMKSKLGADHPDTLTLMGILAIRYHAAGKIELALPLYEETLKLKKSKLGADHPDTLGSMANLALGYHTVGKLDLALPLLEETLKFMKSKLGADHPDTLISMNNLAECYRAAGKIDRALPLFEETLTLRKSKLGVDHQDTLVSMNNLARSYQLAGKLDRALPLFEETAAGIEKRRFQHAYAGTVINNLCDCSEALKQWDKAELWRRKWLAVVKEQAGADSLSYANELSRLGPTLSQQKKWAEAEATLRECLAIRQKHPPQDWSAFDAQSMLGEALLGQKKHAEAETLLLKGYHGIKADATELPEVMRRFLLTKALDRIVDFYESTGKNDEATKWRKELEAVKQSPAPRK